MKNKLIKQWMNQTYTYLFDLFRLNVIGEIDFLANVNSSSCSLYVIVGPSVVCRLSVTLVRPTQTIEIFGNVSTP